MEETNINNDIFLMKIFSRKWKRGVAYHSCTLDHLSMSEKVDFTVRRLMEINAIRARLIVNFWEDSSRIMRIIETSDIRDCQIIREYKKGHVKPGYINVNFKNGILDGKLLKRMIKKHYGNDLSAPCSIDIVPYFVAECNNGEIVAFKLYDDRGFYEYFISETIAKKIVGRLTTGGASPH